MRGLVLFALGTAAMAGISPTPQTFEHLMGKPWEEVQSAVPGAELGLGGARVDPITVLDRKATAIFLFRDRRVNSVVVGFYDSFSAAEFRELNKKLSRHYGAPKACDDMKVNAALKCAWRLSGHNELWTEMAVGAHRNIVQVIFRRAEH